MQLWCVNLVPRCPHYRKLRKRIKNKQKQNYDHSFALNFLIYKIDAKYAELMGSLSSVVILGGLFSNDKS